MSAKRPGSLVINKMHIGFTTMPWQRGIVFILKIDKFQFWFSVIYAAETINAILRDILVIAVNRVWNGEGGDTIS